MSAGVHYEIKVYDGSGRPPRVECVTRDDIVIIQTVIAALLDVRTHRIEIERTES